MLFTVCSPVLFNCGCILGAGFFGRVATYGQVIQVVLGIRIRHHLQNNISREECSILFVGYAVKGSLARHVIDGEKDVRIYGKKVPLRAKIHTINGFSAHADQAEQLARHKQTGKPERTSLIHGEEEIMRQFVTHLEGIEITIPSLNEIFNI